VLAELSVRQAGGIAPIPLQFHPAEAVSA